MRGPFAGWRAVSLAALMASLVAMGPAAIAAEDSPAQLITYGADAAGETRDVRQAIYFAVPETLAGPLYVRLYDPDTGGDHDVTTGRRGETRTRFVLYGGQGADTAPDSRDGDDPGGGRLIAEREFGTDRRLDGRWMTWTRLTAAQGASAGSERVFRIDVIGGSGDDGNVFDIAVSLNRDANIPGDVVRLYSYRPTLRAPQSGEMSELRFKVPTSDGSLALSGRTAGDTSIAYSARFRTVPLKARAGDTWHRAEVTPEADERNRIAAVTVEAGDAPADTTLFLDDQPGGPVAFELPVRTRPTIERPEIRLAVTAIECGLINFDAGASRKDGAPALDALWRFHDGTTARGLEVLREYDKPGRYRVRLELTNTSGLVGDGTARDFDVTVKPAPVARIEASSVIALGATATFDASASSVPDGSGESASYQWRFSDGETRSGKVVERAFTTAGGYSVQLVVRDGSGKGCDSGQAAAKFTVNAPPIADAGPDRAADAGAALQFDGAASKDLDGEIIGYLWDFGDGTRSTARSPLHAWPEPGRYQVTLSITDDSGQTNATTTDDSVITVRRTANAPPEPDAGADRTAIVGELLTFDATGSRDRDGSLIAYNWDFGDGNNVDGIIARYAYARPGRYQVTLTAVDDSGDPNGRQSATATVIVSARENLAPSARPDAKLTAAIGETIDFDGSRSGDPDGNLIAYAWDFGDGGRSTLIRPRHAFAKPGTYQVGLTVRDDSGRPNAAASETLAIKVNAPPVADPGPDQHVTASVVQFDGTGSSDADGKVTDYQWDYGDGTTGSGPRPAHVYRAPGRYQVKLTVGDDSGTIRNTDTRTSAVIINAPPIADAGPGAIATPGEALVFDGTRSVDPDGEIRRYRWDFRDGESAEGELAEHAFKTPGRYMVRLEVRDDSGHEAAFDLAETEVIVNAPPVADAGPDSQIAPGDTVVLNAGRSFDPDGRIESYRWDFSDRETPVFDQRHGRVFDTPGIYKAQLTVIDDSGASNAAATDEAIISVNHRPVAVAGSDVATSNLRFSFDGTGSSDPDGDALTYLWDFGDGEQGSGAQVTHTYATGGTYPVVLRVDDGSRLGNAMAQAAMTLRINRPPVAIAGESREVCNGDVVVFDASKSSDPEGGVLRYRWQFGDGTRSEIINPAKTFDKAGVYPVTLDVTDESGLDNATRSDRIYIRVQQAPVADAGPDLLACVRQPVNFDGSGSTDLDGVINSFAWDFGDGNRGGGDGPAHTYTAPGTYRTRLTITGDQVGACDNTASDEVMVRVIEAPIARIEAPGAAPVGTQVTFDGTGSSVRDGKVAKWNWQFPGGDVAEGARTTYRFDQPGQYPVRLTIESETAAAQCRNISTEKVITINAAPVAEAGPDRVVTTGEAVTFDGKASRDPDGALTAYQWEFGDGTKAGGVQPVHVFTAPGRYQVVLTVSDDSGLGNATHADTAIVEVKDPPTALVEGPDVACVGEQVNLRLANASLDALTSKPRWQLGDGTIADAASVRHAYRSPGRYDVTVLLDQTGTLANSRRFMSRKLHINRPPVAVAGPDRLVCPGDRVEFDGTASRDFDGEIASTRWDFGDGATATGLRAAHTYKSPGTYTVTLTTRDDSGSTCDSATATARVIVNAPPVAIATLTDEAFIGGANDGYWLDGSASRDGNGDGLSYSWQIDGAEAAIGETVRHRFNRPGKIPVKLTVKDGTGLACGIASDTTTVVVKSRQ